MPLTTSMGIDANKSGKKLAYSVLMSESAESIAEVLKIFMAKSDGCSGIDTSCP